MSDQKFNKLRVFLSWSGVRSKAVAQVFRDWLPSVLQNVQPYFTPEDIDKGSRWGGEIRGQLETTDFGVIFLTPENVTAPWLLFEAGALSKLDKSLVAPLLLAMEPAEVSGPLGQLQLTRFTRDDCLMLLGSINRALGDMGLDAAVLEKVFSRAWPELEQRVDDAMALVPTQPVIRRSDRDMLEEVLERVRALEPSGSSASREQSESAAKLLREFKFFHHYQRSAEKSLKDYPFAVQTIEALEESGITTMAELLQLSKTDLLKIPNLGLKAATEVIQTLAIMGHSLRR